MDQIKKIFILYFICFFVPLFIFVSVGQFADQQKVDLKFSLPFTLSLAALGGAIAAIFMGIFRELESEPPRVQRSEYLTIDDTLIRRKLKKIRIRRLLPFIMFLMWIPYGMLIMVLGLPESFIFAYMAGLAVAVFILQFAKCPRCGHHFFFRGARSGGIGDTGNGNLNLLFGGGYHNTFSNKCLNCGLSIKGERNI